MIDLHCHILPGVDDGVATLDDAVELARVAEAEGVRTIVATPHVFRDNFNWGEFSRLEEKYRQLCEEIRKNGLQIAVLKGAEVHISHDLIGALKKNRDQLVINRTSYMFVEFPASHVFSGVKSLFFELMTEGITPIITHPERNLVFVQSPSHLYELIEMGAFAQANSGSFLGLYGDQTQKAVLKFLEHSLIHFIGSDSHSPRSLSTRMGEAVDRAGLIIGAERAAALTGENPEAVINDLNIPSVPPPVDPKKSERSFAIRIPEALRPKKRQREKPGH